MRVKDGREKRKKETEIERREKREEKKLAMR